MLSWGWFIIGLLLVTIKILLLVYYWSPPKFTKILRFLLWINKLFGWKHPGKFGFYSPKCGFYHAALRRAYDPGKKELDIMVWWWRWWWCPIVPLSQKNSAGDLKKKMGTFWTSPEDWTRPARGLEGLDVIDLVCLGAFGAALHVFLNTSIV